MKQLFAGRDDDNLTNVWGNLIEILKEENKRLSNGKFFLHKGGIKLLLKCRKEFPLNTALGEALIRAVYQISLVKELRPQLMSKKVGDTVLSIIFEFFEADLYADANHYASKTLANLLSEGKTTWSFKNLSYDDGCKQLDAIPTKWDNTSVKFEASYSFKTISPLLEYPQCQYFALWALKVQTTKSCCKYVLCQKNNFTNVLQILTYSQCGHIYQLGFSLSVLGLDNIKINMRMHDRFRNFTY